MKDRDPSQRRRVLKHWHMIFGTFLHMRFEPVQIQVELEVPATRTIPKLDILVLRPEGQEVWSEAQREQLPDGLRDCGVGQIILEFKYSENFSDASIRQALSYDWQYRNSRHLSDDQLHSFLISSKTPNPQRLAGMGYQATERPGVYRSNNEVCRYVDVISLNDLTDAPHNLAFKMFASKRDVRASTYDQLMARHEFPEEVVYYLETLYQWSEEGGSEMITNMTKEEIIEHGRKLALASMVHLPYDVRMTGIPIQERLKGASTRERLEGIPYDELLQNIPMDTLRELLNSDERLRALFKTDQNQAG